MVTLEPYSEVRTMGLVGCEVLENERNQEGLQCFGLSNLVLVVPLTDRETGGGEEFCQDKSRIQLMAM